MRNPFHLAMALIAAAGISAQAGDFSATLRGGWGLGRQDGVKDMLGFGLGTSFELSKESAISAEISYFYQPGERQLMGITAPQGVTLSSSANFQKLSATGIGVRAAYVKQLNADWSWQAGAFVSQVKSRMDAIGDVRTSGGQIGGWATNPEKSGMGLSPFAGMIYKIGEHADFQMNLTALRYKQVTATPTWVGTGINTVQLKSGSKDATLLNLEFGLSFRL